MTAVVDRDEILPVGKVVAAYLVLFGRAAVPYFAGGSLFLVLWVRFLIYLERSIGGPGWVWFWISFALSALIGAFLFSCVLAACLGELRQKPLSVYETLQAAAVQYPRVLTINVVTGVATILGLIVFVIPGVMVMVTWSMAAPAAVEERLGLVDAVRRSVELSQGSFWRILGLTLIYLIIDFLGAVVVAAVCGFVGGFIRAFGHAESATRVATQIANEISVALNVCLSAAFVLTLYVALRVMRAGTGLESLASVFD
jgi:hypothetical protein